MQANRKQLNGFDLLLIYEPLGQSWMARVEWPEFFTGISHFIAIHGIEKMQLRIMS